jgi:DNA-binding transcriptional LysR family regulator
MNFKHLFKFFQVARAGSICAGADRLCASQSAVTREIKELEGRLQLRLFDRLLRGVVLTEAGIVRFLPDLYEARASSALAELKDIADVLAKLADIPTPLFVAQRQRIENRCKPGLRLYWQGIQSFPLLALSVVMASRNYERQHGMP